MRIKLVSDLHLEFSNINITNDENCDVLILSGDIMVAQDLYDHPEPADSIDQFVIANSQGLGRRQEAAQRFRDFLKRCSFQFPHVVYIAGNHEFYHGKWNQTIDTLRAECNKFSNVHFLERDTVTINDVLFVGGTLWTNCNNNDPLTLHGLRDMMNDFRLVRVEDAEYRALKPADTVVRHKKTLGYIKHVLDENRDKTCVVVGHHTPSFQSCHPQYANDSIMNGGYHSELSEFILDHPQIQLWTHGHTHHCFDYMIGDTRVVCNPRGYHNGSYGEETGWDPKKVIEI
jgi:Icc-related predicted phosphoesterase